ncbi:MAG: hypothetical protein WBN89_11410 [Prochlorococcaceae cyanobacterium]
MGEPLKERMQRSGFSRASLLDNRHGEWWVLAQMGMIAAHALPRCGHECRRKMPPMETTAAMIGSGQLEEIENRQDLACASFRQGMERLNLARGQGEIQIAG